MKMQKRLILLLLIILAVGLIVGCTAEPEETLAPTRTTTEPTELKTEPPTDPPTEPPTEAPTEAPTAPAEEMHLEDFQALFSWESSMRYNMAAGYEYARAADVDLYYLFYNGVDYPGSWDSISESERELLRNSNFWEEMDIQIMPADILEANLRQYFGLGLADVTIPAEWVYSPETDTYYSNHNDAYGSGVTVTDLETLSDGTVRLYLTVDAVHDHDYMEVVWDAEMCMTLRPVEDGWQIVSNVLAG